MNAERILQAAEVNGDEKREVGTAPWLSALILALVAEVEPATADDVRPIVNKLVALYVRRSTVVAFARLVADMRKAQKMYFETRTPAWLERAKAEESAVDKWVAAALKPVERQRPLFDTTPHKGTYE